MKGEEGGLFVLRNGVVVLDLDGDFRIKVIKASKKSNWKCGEIRDLLSNGSGGAHGPEYDVISKIKKSTNKLTRTDVLAGLKYIADSPVLERGGFHPNTVAVARAALKLIKNSSKPKHDKPNAQNVKLPR